MFARRIFIDIWITAFMSLTLAFFALSERYPERRRLFLGLMYVSIGLGRPDQGPGRDRAAGSLVRALSRSSGESCGGFAR